MTTKRPPYEIMTVATLLAGFIAALRGNVWSTVAVFILAAATVIMYLARLNIDPNGTIKQEQHEQDVNELRTIVEDIAADKKDAEETRYLKHLEDYKLDGTHRPDGDLSARVDEADKNEYLD